MPTKVSKTGSELFIVDNSDQDWKVLRYLHDWCQLSSSMDIATGYFEIGALLALNDEWQKVDTIRILMGDEVSKRTKNAFVEALGAMKRKLDESVEKEKEKNDFLTGVPAIVEAIRSGKIQCRVYRKDKFHAKAYITHARMEVVGSSALVGSSNLTFPGLTENIELNVQITGRQVTVLQEWYDEHWNAAEDVTPDILKVFERHTQPYTPFEVYVRSLMEYFRAHEMTASEWENHDSKIYPILATYQKEAYHSMLKMSGKYNGAFLCDGVGLGKTYVGLMLIERLIILDRRNVALFVPKSARKPVWEKALKKRLPHLFGKYSKLEIFNHSDLLRKGNWKHDLETVRERADVILIDEAHHFRNTGLKGEEGEERISRYWQMFDLCAGKQVFMLTATPINNGFYDLLHMMELFTQKTTDYFKDAPLGIHSIRGYFRQMENALEKLMESRSRKYGSGVETNLIEADAVLRQDALFRATVVQRSRAYVRLSLQQNEDGQVLFPRPREPKVVPYSVKQTYGKILAMVEEAFSRDKPLFSLAIYYPLAYYKDDSKKIDPMDEGRQKQVVALIRTSFLKRFESSVEAFRMSCWALLRKLLAWMEVHVETAAEKKLLERWRRQNDELIHYVHQHEHELFSFGEEDADEDIVPPEMLEAVDKLPREDYKVDEIINETLLDLEQITKFLGKLEDFKPSQDKKLRELVKLLNNDRVLQKHKVMIFTEYMDTARYLKRQLIEEGIDGVAEIDSAVKDDRGEIIERFSPYYNESSSGELAKKKQPEIRVLITTDVLSEGLNLQDATRLINYDLHWNPVRLMQRIGRVDRRMDPQIEARIIADHPEEAELRGETAYWNFLPPEELEDLLGLYKRVSGKTLRISKTFGIEGKKLLKPDDDYEDLRNFSEAYEGKLSTTEQMHLELQKLLKDDPGLADRLNGLPMRVFSGKAHPKENSRAVFFCYGLPGRNAAAEDDEKTAWSMETGLVQWYLYDLDAEKIIEDASEIVEFVRCTPEEPRRCTMEQRTLSEIRADVDKHIKNTYLKKVQAPIGVSQKLIAWMEMN